MEEEQEEKSAASTLDVAETDRAGLGGSADGRGSGEDGESVERHGEGEEVVTKDEAGSDGGGGVALAPSPPSSSPSTNLATSTLAPPANPAAAVGPGAKVRPIDKDTVHRICSGQVGCYECTGVRDGRPFLSLPFSFPFPHFIDAHSLFFFSLPRSLSLSCLSRWPGGVVSGHCCERAAREQPGCRGNQHR